MKIRKNCKSMLIFAFFIKMSCQSKKLKNDFED